MILRRFLVSWESSLRIITLLVVVLILESVGLCLLGWKLQKHRERIVILPPMPVTTTMEIAWNSANREYVKSFALYLATLMGNITPENVQFVADSIGRFFSPKVYSEVRTRLLSLAQDETWVTSAQANFFSPRQVVYEPQTERVFVQGDIITTGFKSLPERKNVIYEMIIHISDGFPVVDYFTSYEGNQPRTLKWILSQPEEERKKYTWLLEKAKRYENELRLRGRS